MEMLAKELADGITTAEHEEETAQKDYERLMSSSQETRAKNVESITTKEAAKAELDTKIEATKEKKVKYLFSKRKIALWRIFPQMIDL